MQKLLLVLFITLVTQVQAQVSYCDSIEISMSLPSNSFPEFSVNLSSLGVSSMTYDWSLTEESGASTLTATAIAIFSLPNNLNSDTNIICLTSTFSASGLTFACNTCDTIVWDGINWVLLSMMPPPCNLTGGSVYVDHSTTPIMMNATVNGISQYTYLWSDASSANQTQYYQNWCVTITDIISGCDTTICENCIADTTNICPCPLIYMPVCGCDGVMYVNYCLAECAEVGWSPAVSNGMPGGFFPCNQPSSCIDSTLIDLSIMCPTVWDPVCGCDNVTYGNSCEAENWNGVTSWIQGACNLCSVEINSGTIDIEICDGDSAILEATTGFDTYIWTFPPILAPIGSTHFIEVSDPGIYIVIVTDTINNCVDMDSIEVIVYPETPLSPTTVPNPPMVCLGDSIVIEVNTGFVNYWWNTGNPLDQGEDRVVVYPTQDFTYVVESLDNNGCESREEIEVFVDTCATGIMNIMSSQIIIYPNPANGMMTISFPKSEIFDLAIYDMMGRLVLSDNKVSQRYIISDKSLENGSYIIKLLHSKGVITKNIIFK